MAELGSIVAFGAHVPRLRLARANIAAAIGWLSAPNKSIPGGRRAICNWDEDAVTLAVEAARTARSMVDAGERIDALAVASTTLPFADRDAAVLVAGALDLPGALETLTLTSSLRAGTGALINAARRKDVRTLVVASDARSAKPGSPQEMSYGHGSAAVLVRPPGVEGTAPALATILAVEQVAADFVDHYRASGQPFDYGLEERWVRDEGYSKLVVDAVAAALRRAGIDAADVAHFAMPGPADVVGRVMKGARLGSASSSGSLREECGDTGAAHPLLMLVEVLERAKPGDLLVLAAFGQGVDVLVLRADPAIARQTLKPLSDALRSGVEEPSYVRYLSHSGLLSVDFGMRAERDNRTAHTVAWRKHRSIGAFVGGRCGQCGTVQFPRSNVCVNPECRATETQQDHPLAGSAGRVKSFTEDWQAYSPRPPAIYGNVEFAEGGNLLMEFTDLAPGRLAVGDPVRFVFRIKDVDQQRAFRRYFWKALRE